VDQTPAQPPPPSVAPAAWYADPEGTGQRWWDGENWGPRAPQQVYVATPMQPVVVLPPQEKSSGVALLLTIFWPGGGHLYLGLTQKSIPYVVANAIGFFMAWTLILVPVTVLIWLVTLCMTVGSLTSDTEFVNAAVRQGRRISG
jgi:hypothetical protein